MAPEESQATLKEFGRPEYDELIAKYPVMSPLFGKDLVAAFHKWDEEIGARKTK
jgi:putative spermidine/putrescine transport system substrate-binding protein